jgi:phosphate starvation-inducible protein PhoH
MTYKELVTLVTRVGEFSKVFILGDPDQSDINGKSGFVKMMNHFEDTESRENGIHTFKFDEDDIVRSALVRFIIKKLKQTNV